MIALLTDFGTEESYIGIVKGVIKRINPMAELIDITHNVRSFSISNAQYHLYSSYRFFPEGTIFYVVIDPGVGTERKALIARDKAYTYVLPNNGILSSVFHRDMEIFEIDTGLFRNASATFHGRDIFAPVAAGLSLGKKPGEFGVKISNFIQKKFTQYILREDSAECSVVHIDKFGNIITSLPNSVFLENDIKPAEIKSDKHMRSLTLCRNYNSLSEGEAGILCGSSGLVELALNRDSLSHRLDISIEESLTILYENKEQNSQ